MGPPRREKVVGGIAFAVMLGALALEWSGDRMARMPPREWAAGAADEYAELWDGLGGEAREAAEVLGSPPEGQDAKMRAFRRLAELVPDEVDQGRGRRALLLLDPDGAAVAWSGEGLLHEPSADEVPRAGRAFQASFTAVTLLAVEPLPSDRQARRPWRVVAGASFPSDRLPFPSGRMLRWSMVRSPQQALAGMLLVPSKSPPYLVVEPVFERVPPAWPWSRQVAWGAFAFVLLALGVMRSPGLSLPGEPAPAARHESPVRLSILTFTGVVAAGMAAGLSWTSLAVLVAGLALAGWGASSWRPLSWWKSRPVDIALRGAVSALLLFLAAWLLQLREPIDLGSAILAEPEAFSLRLAFAAAAFGLLYAAGRRRTDDPPPRELWGWVAAGLLLLGAIVCDFPFLALPLLAAGVAAASVYADARRMGVGLAVAAVVLMAILAASALWETAYRLSLRRWAATELLHKVTPPTREELDALGAEANAHFSRRDLASLVPRTPAGLERQDLAYALWRQSPLARPYSLSALVVMPREGAISSFAFGMPLTQGNRVDWSPERWRELGLPLWEESPVYGEAPLKLAGRPWGVVRFWLMPRPGFELRDRRRLGEVEAGLLKGGPAADPVQELLEPAVYALYTENGLPSLSPWDETPRLSDRLRPTTGEGSAIVDTPVGRARAYSHMTLGVWEVIYLPFLQPFRALERTANPGVGLLMLLALAAPPVLLLSLPRASFRALLGRVMRSYSKRLIIVYTVLLLVPLLLLNVVLVGAMEDRLEHQQRAAGEAALASAQQILGERLLRLEPGFGVDTALGDKLLIELSEIVHHEVNLYWGSSIYASSRHELFTAGLLPNRIPGEIYSRLALLGFELSARTNRVGETDYLEVYAPLRLPGVPVEEERLFLSMPLLAQQEEAAQELAHLRGQGILVTVGLFLLLVAVGTRLARNFTRPLMELIEGTRRIAAGATSLNLAPTELELAALVQAVDDMALRIAEARERLVREKQVVERMVENITSGVVSLDRERRVLMHNRVAAELLGVSVGQSLDRGVEEARLAPVAGFLREAVQRPGEMHRQTIRLSELGGGGEREWSLVWVPVPGAGEPSALLVVEDATEVLRGQRLLAWAEMARIIAHEIKNPLTPIRLSTEHLREVYQRAPEQLDRVFERCTVNILTQVEELRSIASEFSTYSTILNIDPKPGDLTATIADLVEGYLAAPPEGVKVELETNGPIPARFDAKLLGRAVRNLLENAMRASAGGGRVTVKVERQNGLARISVMDEGPGVRPENLPRIFDPYFSTHDTGTGLGLPIARRVAEEHGGSIAARNRPERGLEVVITLPVSPFTDA
ncbi:MAG: two-component system, NtrC family, nitrogen regulation sensor histidine kinase NtrY [Acidobacteriota bacterium]|nr:two-component system, NtrC family, nitrogen regulation sensor histidine kinase NtrY [Acidobacteriota bacterium]